jgi:hypothetical protein
MKAGIPRFDMRPRPIDHPPIETGIRSERRGKQMARNSPASTAYVQKPPAGLKHT